MEAEREREREKKEVEEGMHQHVVIGKGTKPDRRCYSPLIGKTRRRVEDKRERP